MISENPSKALLFTLPCRSGEWTTCTFDLVQQAEVDFVLIRLSLFNSLLLYSFFPSTEFWTTPRSSRKDTSSTMRTEFDDNGYYECVLLQRFKRKVLRLWVIHPLLYKRRWTHMKILTALNSFHIDRRATGLANRSFTTSSSFITKPASDLGGMPTDDSPLFIELSSLSTRGKGTKKNKSNILADGVFHEDCNGACSRRRCQQSD